METKVPWSALWSWLCSSKPKGLRTRGASGGSSRLWLEGWEPEVPMSEGRSKDIPAQAESKFALPFFFVVFTHLMAWMMLTTLVRQSLWTLLIQMLISSRNTLTEISIYNIYQLSVYLLAQSNWHINFHKRGPTELERMQRFCKSTTENRTFTHGSGTNWSIRKKDWVHTHIAQEL